MLRGISEILAEACAHKRKEDIIATLQHPKYNTFALRHVLRCCFDPSVIWALPEGPIDYKPCIYVDQEGMLYTEARRFYLFIEGGQPNITPERRLVLFVQLLETLMPDDANLLINIKDKKLPAAYKKITSELVLEAFPGLF